MAAVPLKSIATLKPLCLSPT